MSRSSFSTESTRDMSRNAKTTVSSDLKLDVWRRSSGAALTSATFSKVWGREMSYTRIAPSASL